MVPINHTRVCIDIPTDVFITVKTLAVARNITLKRLVLRLLVKDIKEAVDLGFKLNIPKEKSDPVQDSNDAT